MKKFFGTLERNRLLLDDLQKILNDMESASCKSLFDPALGEIVLVRLIYIDCFGYEIILNFYI